MKRILVFLSICCSLSVQAQDLKSLYVAQPDSLSLLLTKVNREDFGDFLESHMKAEVKNRFGKPSEMKKMTDDYLLLQETSVNTVEMKLLPLNDSAKVICVVTTYMAPVPDSHISFYDTQWHPLPASQFITLPPEEAFYRSVPEGGQADSLKNLRMQADVFLLKASLSAEAPTLSFTYTTPDYLYKETALRLRPYLVASPLRYEWQHGKFVKVER